MLSALQLPTDIKNSQNVLLRQSLSQKPAHPSNGVCFSHEKHDFKEISYRPYGYESGLHECQLASNICIMLRLEQACE